MWQSSLLLPFLVALAFFAAPSRAIGPCYKTHRTDLKIGTPYLLPRQPGAPLTWTDRIQDYENDTFTVLFNNQNQLDMDSLKKATKVHLYLIIFIYSSGPNDLLLLNGGDQCVGVANGESVKVPIEVRVARITGP
jgi:hypothetical protein